MNPANSPLLVDRCARCGARFLPGPGACPRCGGTRFAPDAVDATGVVLASTELLAPAEGWTAPHRLVLAECAGEVRVLGICEGEIPPPGASVRVARDGDVYRILIAPRPAR